MININLITDKYFLNLRLNASIGIYSCFVFCLRNINRISGGKFSPSLSLVQKKLSGYIDEKKSRAFQKQNPASVSNQITFPADLEKLEKALNQIKDDMAQYNLSQKAQFNMITAAEEIFSNIAQYAYSAHEQAVVTIKSDLIGSMYYLTFVDNGKKYNPLENKNPDITSDIKDKKIGGLGIYLVKKLTDEQAYSYSDEQNILRIGIDINK